MYGNQVYMLCLNFVQIPGYVLEDTIFIIILLIENYN